MCQVTDSLRTGTVINGPQIFLEQEKDQWRIADMMLLRTVGLTMLNFSLIRGWTGIYCLASWWLRLTQGARKIRAAGDVVEVLRLHLLLVRFAVVEVVEVGDDDGHRQRDGEHTRDGAQRTHDLAPHTHGPAKQRRQRVWGQRGRPRGRDWGGGRQRKREKPLARHSHDNESTHQGTGHKGTGPGRGEKREGEAGRQAGIDVPWTWSPSACSTKHMQELTPLPTPAFRGHSR